MLFRSFPVTIDPLQDKINRWSVFYAKKSPDNSLVVGSDIYQYSVEKDGNYLNAAGNFTPSWLTSGGLTALDLIPRKAKVRGHSLDLMLNKSIRPTYVRFEYNLSKVLNFNSLYTGFRSNGSILAKTNQDPVDNKDITAAVLDYTVPASSVVNNISPSFQRVDNFQYVPENSILNTVDNRNSEGIFFFDLFSIPSHISSGVDGGFVKMITSRVARFAPEIS